ncbi:MAG: YneF family protein [Bacilli bacterium]|nr:YneF family protein [Bacilli bacterium]
MLEFAIWVFILIILGVLVVGAIVGFFISRTVFTKYLEKNPPVNEKMIRVMMQQMGRTPSEKQVRQIMVQMNQAKTK